MNNDNKIINTCLELQEIVDNRLAYSTSDVNGIRYKLQIFLIAQAKKELQRVVKLTEVLDRLEGFYEEKVIEFIENHRDEDSTILAAQGFIKVISDSIDRSQSLIRDILNDDRIMGVNLEFQAVDTLDSDSKSEDPLITLSDPRSRDKVRTVIGSILSSLDSMERKSIEDKESK